MQCVARSLIEESLAPAGRFVVGGSPTDFTAFWLGWGTLIWGNLFHCAGRDFDVRSQVAGGPSSSSTG